MQPMKNRASISHIHLESIDSTNEYAKRSCHSFDPGRITCITAEEQTAGRGRSNRQWISPKGSDLYATFYFRLPMPLHHAHIANLAQVIASSLIAVLLDRGLSPRFKWPNDVQLDGKKVSGVLCETAFHPYYADFFLGIGVNVNREKSALERIDQPATSLKQETGHAWDLKEFLRRLQERFVDDLDLFQREGFAAFHKRLDSLLAYRGQPIRCFDGNKEWKGICHSLNEDGRLNLLLPDGQIHAFFSGDTIPNVIQ